MSASWNQRLFHVIGEAPDQSVFARSEVTISPDTYAPTHGSLYSSQPNHTNIIATVESISDRLDSGKSWSELNVQDPSSLFREVTYSLYTMNRRHWEPIFERVRSQEYSDLPSRRSCVFLTEVFDVPEWYDKIRRPHEAIQIVEVVPISGAIHRADAVLLDEIGFWREEEYEEQARRYWRGEASRNGAPLWEVLYHGHLEVKQRWDNLQSFVLEVPIPHSR
jgi:hypothetical protein